MCGPILERSFQKPWHAQLFAMTIVLHENGLIGWPEWTAQLGEELSGSRHAAEGDSGDQYYQAWLAAMEKLLDELGLISEQEFRAAVDAVGSGSAG